MTEHLHKKLQELGGPYKSLTCLNSHLPEADFFSIDLPIIAADGALNRLMKMGVVPDVVIGDLDSAEEGYLNQVPSICIDDQNNSDFEKTIAYLKQKDLLPTLVLGAGGGFFDHVLYNTQIIIKHNLMFYNPPILGITVHQSQSFELPLNTKLSILGDGVVSSKGLKWNLHQTKFELIKTSSCFNRSVEPKITLRIQQGTVMLLIYLDPVEDAGGF